MEIPYFLHYSKLKGKKPGLFYSKAGEIGFIALSVPLLFSMISIF